MNAEPAIQVPAETPIPVLHAPPTSGEFPTWQIPPGLPALKPSLQVPAHAQGIEIVLNSGFSYAFLFFIVIHI